MTARLAPRPDLELVAGYHSARVDAAVRLNVNESPYPPPAGFREALADELASVELNRYPDRAARRLRSAIGELHGVEMEQVLATKGSNEALQALCLAYGGRGRVAAVFEPTYALHSHIARITGTGVAVGERSTDFSLDATEVRRVLEEARPALTLLCSPNNPTGAADSPETVADVVAQAPGLVVVDEAYAQFSPWSALPLVSRNAGVVVTRTYSKTWSLAAARLGYLVAAPEVVADIEQVLLPYHLDALTQAAGLVALRFADEMEERVKLLVAERERLVASLSAMPLTVWPSDANFILFRPLDEHGDPEEAGRALWRALVERSVLVRDCSSWPRLAGCLRVTVGTPAENDAFLDALAEVVS